MERWFKAQKRERATWIKTSKTCKRPEERRWREFLHTSKHLIPAIQESDITLDIGCGPDGLIFYFPGKQRIGIDPLIDPYTQCYDISRDVSLVKSIGETLPFRRSSINVIFCINMLDHTVNPKQCLKEMKRVLKPKGFLLLAVNTEPIIDKFFIKLGYRTPLNEFHPHKLLPKEVIRGLEEAGVQIIKMDYKASPSLTQIFSRGIRKVKTSFLSHRMKENASEHISDIPMKRSLIYHFLRTLDYGLYFFSKNYFAGEIRVLAQKETSFQLG